MRSSASLLLVLMLPLIACGGSSRTDDGGTQPSPDAHVPAQPDADVEDASSDANQGGESDASEPAPSDAGSEEPEAGVEMDAGEPAPSDGGTEDAGGPVSSPVPTTCDEAHGGIGCCSDDDVLHYFDGDRVYSNDCKIYELRCGWTGSAYDCVSNASSDPSGTFPLACFGEPIPVACSPDANGPKTCEEAHGEMGCCVGDTLYYFENGVVHSQACRPLGFGCGWRDQQGFYGCTTEPAGDPSGTYSGVCFSEPAAGLCAP